MKKLISKSESEKKQKRNSLIVGLVLIFIMLFSTFAIIVNSFGSNDSSSKIKYKGYTFVFSNELWQTSLGNYTFGFKFLPNQTTNIIGNLNHISNYENKPLYLSSQDYYSQQEVVRNIGQVAERIQPACSSGENCSSDFPIKTCENNFIIIKESNISRITQSQNCVYIEGNKENLTSITDEFILKTIGVN